MVSRLPKKWSLSMQAFWVRMYDLPLVCMGKNVGYKIGASVGEVEDVDIVDGDPGWGGIPHSENQA
jgi:hypothetical protein